VSVFVDTSALLAVMVEDSLGHDDALRMWDQLLDSDELLVTSNYVVLELCSILQKRHGMSAVRNAVGDILPPIEILWVDRSTHDAALEALVTANRRQLSLVDCVSFVVMREQGIQRVATLDRHFAEQGFEALPG